MFKIIALFGGSGSGKDTLLNGILKLYPNQLYKIISYTTRQKRENEKDGEDYFFISVEEFTKKVLNTSIIEASQWGGEFYGSGYDCLDAEKINIGIFDEKGIEYLLENKELQVYPILICAEDKTRLIRVLEREKNPNCEKICKRFLEDLKRFNIEFDFNYFSFYNGKSVNNPIQNFERFLIWKDLIKR